MGWFGDWHKKMWNTPDMVGFTRVSDDTGFEKRKDAWGREKAVDSNHVTSFHIKGFGSMVWGHFPKPEKVKPYMIRHFKEENIRHDRRSKIDMMFDNDEVDAVPVKKLKQIEFEEDE